MDISIIVPFHNSETFIEPCLEALLHQDYPRTRFEILMVENNSTDRSEQIVRRYPEVRLLHEPEPGPYAARNRGVRESTGEVVAFTDSDCAPRSDWLRSIRGVMQSPTVCLVQGQRRPGADSRVLSMIADYEAAKAEYIFSSNEGAIYFGYTNNMAVRRTAFEQVGPFLEWVRGSDSVFVHRVVTRYGCAAVSYAPEMYIRHLELTGLHTWLKKMRLYGVSSIRQGQVERRRPLNRHERLTIFRNTIRSHRYSASKSAVLAGLLMTGFAAFELGRRTGPPHAAERSSLRH